MTKLQAEVENIKKLINQSQNIAVVGHQNPDGDCIGCCVAMSEWLVSKGKTISIFADGDIPEKFFYMPKAREFNQHSAIEHFDLLIVLDLSDVDRLGVWNSLTAKSDKIIVIDHHIKPAFNQADILIDLPQYASCGEIIYDLFELLKVKITFEIATALYTCITCDTGCFLFSNTTANTHRVAEALMAKHKIDIEAINFKNFRAYDRRNIPVVTYVLKNMKFEFGGRLSISVLPYKFVKKWNLNYESRHGLFKYATDANGVICSIFITELSKGEFNVSLRSLGTIDVAKIAQKLNGGGHRNASGATYHGSLKDLKQILVSEFAQVID
ncbi:MAG: bifunctional oligoribonuclease/PAP phosphatase NrnA [Clostridia bacterium]|nr:bifunctional oligoribonuclease/PAP phosphatase NrnA [Clostridia bacterium]